MEVVVEVNRKVYEISELITKITYTDQLNDGCSKLEFSYINEKLIIENGSIIRFRYNNADIFYGVVFKRGQNKNKEITVTAYDQLRYCKAKDTIVSKNDTVTTLTKKMCNYFGLKTGTLTDTQYTLPTNVKDDTTWLDIIYSAITETLTNKGEWYALRDEYGSICIRNLADLKLGFVLGDKSLCYGFSYQKSIDDEFYNQIKIVSDNETTGQRDEYIKMDNKSIEKFGLLQYFEVLDKNSNPSQVKAKADALIKLYNEERQTLNLECLGDTRIRAGSSFYLTLGDIGIVEKRMIVRSVTHNYMPNHTMSLEVAI